MYFAKFFHKDPDDDRLLLYTPNTLMGIFAKKVDMSAWLKAPSDVDIPSEFLRREYETFHEGAAAFRGEIARLRSAGYIETHHTKYTLRDLEGDYTPKPEWQRALDEAILAAFADPAVKQREHLAALADTPAANEPTTLWLLAHCLSAAGSADALEHAVRARDAILARKAAVEPSHGWDDLGSHREEKWPYYSWSLRPAAIEAHALELLARRYLIAGDPPAALAAIEQAMEAVLDTDRSATRADILCDHFPDRREDAFDDVYRYVQHGGFESIVSRPEYADYAAQRAADAIARRTTWRWSGGSAPATEAKIVEAERALECTFPEDYRAFLRERGKSALYFRMPMEHGKLKFFAPEELARQRADFISFATLTDTKETAAEAFAEEYGVSLRHLIPIAEPESVSNALLLHLGPGDKYGFCYVWNHDGAWELVNEQKSFSAMLQMLLDGMVSGDRAALDLFNIWPESEE